jgi:hypothetical protein
MDIIQFGLYDLQLKARAYIYNGIEYFFINDVRHYNNRQPLSEQEIIDLITITSENKVKVFFDDNCIWLRSEEPMPDYSKIKFIDLS